MEKYIRKQIRKIIFESFIQENALDESLEGLLNTYTNPEMKAKAQEWAKEMNNKGEASRITLDSDSPPGFFTLKLAMETLLDAYRQDSGKYYLNKIDETIIINKENIIKAFQNAVHPALKNFKFLLGKSAKAIETHPDIFKHLSGLVQGTMVKGMTLQNYENWTGEKRERGELPKMSYYVTKYLNEKEKGYDKESNNFLNYIKNYYATVVNAYFKDMSRKAERTVSLDAKMGDNGATHASMLRSTSNNDEDYGNVMQAAIGVIGQKIIESGLIGQKSSKLNNFLNKTYFEILLDLAINRSDLNTSNLRNREIVQMHETNSFPKPEFKAFFEALWNKQKRGTETTNRELYDNNFTLMWKAESKEIKRNAKKEIYSNMNEIKSLAVSTGMPSKEAAELAVKYVIEKPEAVNAVLKELMKKTEEINQQTQQNEPTSDNSQSSIDSFYRDNPEFADEEDVYSPEMVNIDDIDDEYLEESEMSPSEALYPSFEIMGQIFTNFLNAEQQVKEINEAKKIIRKVISTSLNKK